MRANPDILGWSRGMCGMKQEAYLCRALTPQAEAATLAPASKRSCTAASRPYPAANTNGVRPCSSRMSGEPPASR